jgi:hypothetical protein
MALRPCGWCSTVNECIDDLSLIEIAGGRQGFPRFRRLRCLFSDALAKPIKKAFEEVTKEFTTGKCPGGLLGSYQKRRGRILFRDPAPLDPIFEDPVRSPDHKLVIAKSCESHKLRGSLSLPFPHSCKSFLSAPFVAVQFPGGSVSLVADSPGSRSPLSPWKIALPLIRIILASPMAIAGSETFCYVEMK